MTTEVMVKGLIDDGIWVQPLGNGTYLVDGIITGDQKEVWSEEELREEFEALYGE